MSFKNDPAQPRSSKNGPSPPDPEATERAKKFLHETNWDQYWEKLSARMQADSAFHDFSFLWDADRGP
jgi:hypothetical protein